MNHLGRTALVAVALLVWRGPSAFGQIPNNVKTATDVTANRPLIEQFINDNVKKLSGDEPGPQGDARDALVGAATLAGSSAVASGGAGQPQPSPAYLDAYTQALDRALVPLANNPDMRVRLNAAIVTAKVADKANNARLANAAVKFMNDKQPAVALWGVKAARAMMPSVVAAPGQNPITPALAQTVQRHALANIIIEVYEALTLNLFNLPSGQRPPPNAIKAAIPEMLKVFRMRVDGYAGGLPPDPSVDNIPAEWLAFQPVWTQMTPAQQLATVQTISDLLGLLARQVELMSEDERTPVLPVFKRTGKALQAIADANNLPQVSAAAKVVQTISSGTDGGDVRKATDAVTAALKAAPQFAAIKPPPDIVIAPEPDAATAPEPGTEKGGAEKGAPEKGGAAPGASDGRARKAGGPEATPAAPQPQQGQGTTPAPAPPPGRAPAPPPPGPGRSQK